MKKTILSIAFLFCSFSGFAQDTTSHSPEKLGFSWPRYRLGDKKISRKEFKQELMNFSESGKLFKKHKTQLYVGGGLLVAGAVLYNIGDKRRFFIGPRKIPTATIIAFPMVITGSVFSISSIGSLQKAVKYRNKAVTLY